MNPVIKVSNLSKNFGKIQALNGVSFEVNPGEIVGFIGPNGSGKSTTLRILLGIIRSDQGTAEIFGQDVWRDSLKIHERVAYVPGDVALWGNLSGGEIIDLFMALHGSGKPAKRDALIERFELDPRRKAKTYSKGNRQKVALISALAVEADLYIFDEPTSGLDPLMEKLFQQEVQALKAAGKSVLLSSHILSEVDKLSDRVIIIRQGQIVEEGRLADLRHLSRSQVRLQVSQAAESLAQLEGVHDFRQTGEDISFSVDKEALNNVLQRVSELEVRNFEVTPASLEEIFLSHYRA